MLSVVIPVHNEADNIDQLIDEVHAALAATISEYELLYVDDGSTDTTLERLTTRKPHDPRLRVLRHDRSYGQSTALRTGVHAAAYPWIATLDGDGQNVPGDIMALWNARPPELSPDVPWIAIGHRTERKDVWTKRWASRLANRLRGRVLRDRTPDTGCGLKLFSRETFLALPWFDHCHRYLPALVQRAGGDSVSVPVGHRGRWSGRSNYGIWDRAWVGAWDLMGVAWLIQRSSLPSIEELN